MIVALRDNTLRAREESVRVELGGHVLPVLSTLVPALPAGPVLPAGLVPSRVDEFKFGPLQTDADEPASER